MMGSAMGSGICMYEASNNCMDIFSFITFSSWASCFRV